MKQVSFLSHVILEETIFMGSRRTQNVLSLDTPINVTDSQSFLGLVGHYRKFIKEFLKIAKPMIELLGRTRSSSGCRMWS
jgi:hypothetical protein